MHSNLAMNGQLPTSLPRVDPSLSAEDAYDRSSPCWLCRSSHSYERYVTTESICRLRFLLFTSVVFIVAANIRKAR